MDDTFLELTFQYAENILLHFRQAGIEILSPVYEVSREDDKKAMPKAK